MAKRVRFKRLKYNDFLLIQQPNSDTLYFILDKPFIYLGSVQYGCELDSTKHIINDVSFDSETNELIIGVLNGESERIPLSIKNATVDNDGLMTSDQVKELEKNSKALEGVDNVKDYVNEQVELNVDPNWNEVP